MIIKVDCSSCGAKLRVKLTGRTVACPRCKTPIVLPTQEVNDVENLAAEYLSDTVVPSPTFSVPAPTASVEDEHPFVCPFCEEAYSVSAEMGGKSVLCRNCRGSSNVAVPKRTTPPPPPARPTLDAPFKKGRKTVLYAAACAAWLTVGVGVLLGVRYMRAEKVEKSSVVASSPRQHEEAERRLAQARNETNRLNQEAEAARRKLLLVQADIDRSNRQLSNDRAIREQADIERANREDERRAKVVAERQRVSRERLAKERLAKTRMDEQKASKRLASAKAAQRIQDYHEEVKRNDPIASTRCLHIQLALVELKAICRDYAKGTLTDEKVWKMTNAIDKDVAKELVNITRIGGEWMPFSDSDVTISTAWEAFGAKLGDILTRGNMSRP